MEAMAPALHNPMAEPDGNDDGDKVAAAGDGDGAVGFWRNAWMLIPDVMVQIGHARRKD